MTQTLGAGTVGGSERAARACAARTGLLSRLSSRMAFGLNVTALVLLLGAIVPAKSQAAMPDANIMFDYGFKGFTLGVEVGLALGYLSAGYYTQDDWRYLVMGVGIGALAGVTTGVLTALIEVTNASRIGYGYYILRDANYGTWIGAAMGAAVGALLWVDNGAPRDILQGMAYGTWFGAISGAAWGVIEGQNTTDVPPPARPYPYDEWGFSVAPIPSARSAGVAAVIARRF